MVIKKIFLILLINFVIIFIKGYSQSSSGAEILTYRIEPRPIALGETFTAVADDVNTLYYNPAGLIQLENKVIDIIYNKGMEDIFNGSISFVHPLQEKNGFGVSFNFFHLGNMDIYQEDGAIDNILLGNSFILGLSYSHSLLDNFIFLGASAKFVSSTLGNYHSTTEAMDVGILLFPIYISSITLNRISIGFTVQNIGPGLKFIDTYDPLPLTYRMGINFHYYFIRIVNDLVKINYEKFLINHTGIEIEVLKILAIRTGYQFNTGSSFQYNYVLSGGLGLQIMSYQIDYAIKLAKSDLAPISHYFSIAYKF